MFEFHRRIGWAYNNEMQDHNPKSLTYLHQILKLPIVILFPIFHRAQPGAKANSWIPPRTHEFNSYVGKLKFSWQAFGGRSYTRCNVCRMGQFEFHNEFRVLQMDKYWFGQTWFKWMQHHEIRWKFAYSSTVPGSQLFNQVQSHPSNATSERYFCVEACS